MVVGRMRDAIARAERPRPDARVAARDYIARGWWVVPLPRRSTTAVNAAWPTSDHRQKIVVTDGAV